MLQLGEGLPDVQFLSVHVLLANLVSQNAAGSLFFNSLYKTAKKGRSGKVASMGRLFSYRGQFPDNAFLERKKGLSITNVFTLTGYIFPRCQVAKVKVLLCNFLFHNASFDFLSENCD